MSLDQTSPIGITTSKYNASHPKKEEIIKNEYYQNPISPVVKKEENVNKNNELYSETEEKAPQNYSQNIDTPILESEEITETIL